MIVGQTGSGKTTSTLTILDQLQTNAQANIVLDPTGEYAQLPNAIVYRLGENAYLEPGEFSASQLIDALGLKFDSQLKMAAVFAVNDLKIQNNLLKAATYASVSQSIRTNMKLNSWGAGLNRMTCNCFLTN